MLFYFLSVLGIALEQQAPCEVGVEACPWAGRPPQAWREPNNNSRIFLHFAVVKK